MSMATRNDGNARSVVILDPDDGSPLIVIVPEQAAPAKSDKALPPERDAQPATDKK